MPEAWINACTGRTSENRPFFLSSPLPLLKHRQFTGDHAAPTSPREFKIALVEKSMMPGVSVAQLARENNINDNLLFNWRRLYQQGLSGTPANTPALFPVTLLATERPVSPLTPSEETGR